MLETILRARIPLVSITTDDPIFVNEVLNFAVGSTSEFLEIDFKSLRRLKEENIHSQSNFFYVLAPESDMDWVMIYDVCDRTDKTIVLVNPGFTSDLFYDFGELPTPLSLIQVYVASFVGKKKAPVIAPLFLGRTLKTVHWFCQLAIAHHGTLTVESAQYVLKHNQPSIRGLVQVPLDFPYYKPEPSVRRWWLNKGRLFGNKKTPKVLLPRGILCHGSPGTGKTLSAKAIAKRMDVNLYRIDLNGILDMYVGNSETFLTDALNYVEQVAPCVLLFDEVEKLFIRDDAAGVIDRLLSMLLWWMQEHRSLVLVFMTTNNMDVLPPELYRQGRIDSVIEFKGLQTRSVPHFVKGVLNSVSDTPLLEEEKVEQLIRDIQKTIKTEDKPHTQSEYTELIYDQIRPLFIGDHTNE